MSARHWTPAELDLLIHSYSLREEYPYRNTPSFESIYMRLRELDLITVDLRTTEKGNVLVELLLRTPEPRNVWLDPRDGKEIIQERSHPTLDRMIDVTKSARDWLG